MRTMTTPEGYNISVISGLRASFKQPAGPSRAGTDWAVSLANSSGERQIFVRTYGDDIGEISQEQEVRLVIDFVAQLLSSGWSPEKYLGKPGELVVSVKGK